MLGSGNVLGPKPFETGKFPNVTSDCAVAAKFVNLSIGDPPKFDVTKYESFRRELLWWRDVHSSFDDSVLITTLAIKITDESMKSLLTSFTESTRENREARNFSQLINVFDKEYAKTSEELALGK